MTTDRSLGRETLPIPDISYGGLVTYDAKGRDTLLPTGRNHHSVGMDGDKAAEDLDHLITPERGVHMAMARQ